MKKVAAVLLVLGFVSSSVFGATARFEQTSPDPYNDPLLGDTTATFNVWVDSSELWPGGPTAVDVIVGATDGLMLTDFIINRDAGFTLFQDGAPANPPVYPSDLKAGGVSFGGKLPMPLLVGTLTLDANGVSAGLHVDSLLLDSTIDGDSSKLQNGDDPGVIDPLSAPAASVNVLPEPATLSLLALASLAFIRRRKVA